ncbi:class I SAM-dependent methyltransferase [Pararhizobium mangrovi]|uniref:class I SAM-dependent methyltransferase n=1 Tax=Pararhizobium mangrovi TaxID=2590452 RepID=UPI0038B3DA8F
MIVPDKRRKFRSRHEQPQRAKASHGGRPATARAPRAGNGTGTATAPAEIPPQPAKRSGARPEERVPLVLETANEAGYALIDSGAGEKLERYGDLRVVRPEAQALWPKALGEDAWASADAVFTGDTEEEGMGRWRFPKGALGETWPMRLLDVDFNGRFTAFRHVGVFPEQAVHWAFMREAIRNAGRPVKVLNLFGYTGVASLVAAAAGAQVTHIDASKKAIGWARENQALAGLQERPIRWICEDAMKFIARERRRGSRYDIVLTDPPKFGRGPGGEVWQLFDHLPTMLDTARDLLSESPLALVLTAYSIRASFYSMHELMRETMRGAGGCVESGELIIRETGEAGETGDTPGRALSTSLFSRWVPA